MFEGFTRPLLERRRRPRTLVVTLNLLVIVSGIYIASTNGALATWITALGF